MNQVVAEQSNNSNKRLLVVLFIVFIGTGTSLYLYNRNKADQPAKVLTKAIIKKRASGTKPVMAIKNQAPERKAKNIPPSVSRKRMTLQQEISFFNRKHSIPFDNSFHDGYASLSTDVANTIHEENGYRITFSDSSLLTTPAYYDSCIYVSGGFNSRAFYSFNAYTGKQVWSVNLSDDGPSSPIVTDSMVIFNTESCTIFALERQTGKMAWSKWLGDPLLTNPATDGNLVFTAYPSMTLFMNPAKTDSFHLLVPSHPFVALDIHTGKIKWQRWLDGDVMATPIVSGNDLFLTTFSGTMYRLSKEDGKILTAAKLDITSLPAIRGDKIYTTRKKIIDGEFYESIIELDKNSLSLLRTLSTRKAPYLDFNIQKESQLKKNSTVLDTKNGFGITPDQCGWKKASLLIGQSNVSSLQSFIGSTITINGKNLFNCAGDIIQSIDIESGQINWTYKIEGDLQKEGGHLATIPLICDESVITVTTSGKALFLDKSNGNLTKRISTNAEVRNQPIIVSGLIFIPTVRNGLITLDTKQKSFGGWPMFMKNFLHNAEID